MTMTPIATIADALIDFILSLLHDPAAAADYQKDPQASLANAGLSNACLADVRQVAPVIYDRPDVVPRPEPTPPTPTPHPPTPVQQAINTIVNNFAVDNRATVVDQSVNQNIWAQGDVNQVFDQHAVLNTGDGGAAAGHDAAVDNSATAIGHDLNVGNTTNTTDVDGSFNDNSAHTSTDTDTTVTDSFDDSSTTTSSDTTADDSFTGAADDDAGTQTTSDHTDAGADSGADAALYSSSDAPADAEHDSTPPEDLFPDDQP